MGSREKGPLRGGKQGEGVIERWVVRSQGHYELGSREKGSLRGRYYRDQRWVRGGGRMNTPL